MIPSEVKDGSILSDSQDPQFLSNLSHLGQVKINQPSITFEPQATTIQNRLKSSKEEIELGRLPYNRIETSDLVELLNRLKTVDTEEEAEELITEMNMDPAVLREVARRFNSVSAARNKGAKDELEMTAKWVPNIWYR